MTLDRYETPEKTTDATIRLWATRELAPWLANPIDRQDAAREFSNLDAKRRPITLFRIQDGHVTITGKTPTDPATTDGYARRAFLYRDLLQEAAAATATNLDLLLCASMDDAPIPHPRLPVFAFQKLAGARQVLLPDIDFLIHQYYAGAHFQDSIPYDQKRIQAYFVGSMTGGRITEEAIRNLTLPRLGAGQHFHGNPDITYELHLLGDFESEQAKRLAENLPFCGQTPRPWGEHFEHRFLISMDGNGATCSRMALALMSQSALLKYESPYVLFYFGGLRPWEHYVPIRENADVQTILALEQRHPGTLRALAAMGRSFAEAFLTRSRVVQYTSELLVQYSLCFQSP